LIPLRKRTVSKKNYNKVLANMKAVGLIEPLGVCQEGDQYFILDGHIRYTALLERGIETVPCLVLAGRDLYTPPMSPVPAHSTVARGPVLNRYGSFAFGGSIIVTSMASRLAQGRLMSNHSMWLLYFVRTCLA
jgi:hypothetical protein